MDVMRALGNAYSVVSVSLGRCRVRGDVLRRNGVGGFQGHRKGVVTFAVEPPPRGRRVSQTQPSPSELFPSA